ncbi:MAG: hypothetical protein JNJ98_18745 [Gemmatimonadetes bacterium]|nr:hypothetical protein [Gemmatimonadota bacterium]
MTDTTMRVGGPAAPVGRATGAEAVATPWLGYVVVALQVLAVAWLVRAFQVESPAFYDRVLPIAVGAAFVHHFLPAAARLPFFLAASIGAIVAVFGLVGGAWLVGLAGGMIVLAHLPIAWPARIGLLLVVGVVLGFARAGTFPVPWTGAIWPIFGSMFMFRLVAYLYDLRHQKGPVEWTRAFAYFLLLPNVTFPLFPVVDYATFKRTHYDRPALDIYRQGVAWMLRGVVQLLLYRIIYERLVLSPRDVVTLGDFVQYAVGTYGLYLKVSGQFHLIVGILHLFGFRLPETHRFFYLASSFSDYWRRVNIYWKDFMMKVVFYPTFFISKKWGERLGLGVAVAAVFLVSWSTHSYQWFWILGTWLWSATDATFWACFGALMVWTSLRELKNPRARQLGHVTPTWRASVRVGLQTAGVFTTICLLWTFWNSPSFTAFFETVGRVRFTWGGVGGAVAVVAVLTAAGAALHRWSPPPGAPTTGHARWATVGNLTALATLWALGESRIAIHLPPAVASLAIDTRTIDLNKRDADELQRGYYENLVGASTLNGQLWNLYAQRGENTPDLRELGIVVDTEDATHTALAPLKSVVFQGTSFRTNSHGMRDREYPLAADAGVERIAILGSSYVLGMGVSDRDVFEAVVERRFAQAGGSPVELLNFAMPRWSLGQQLAILKNGRVAGFRPGTVVVVGNPIDFDRVIDWLHVEVLQGHAVEDTLLRRIVEETQLAGIRATRTAQQTLAPYREVLVRWALQQTREAIVAMGARPLFLIIPVTDQPATDPDGALVARLAREAGWPVEDMMDVYGGRPATDVAVAAWDRHPNTLGHQLIADRVYATLARHLGRPE